MKPTRIDIFLAVIFFTVTGIMCSSSLDTVDEIKAYLSYQEPLRNLFIQGYSEFSNKNYQTAASLFSELIEHDTIFYQYESIAFLAESYKQLKQPELGGTVYEIAVRKLEKKLRENKFDYLDSLKFKSISMWKQLYPDFPPNLEVKNGFLPFDKVANPIFIKDPEYPAVSRSGHTTGTCWLRAIIDDRGAVIRVYVLKSLNQVLDDKAVKACFQWSFTPAQRKGKAAPSEFIIPFSYGITTLRINSN